MIRRVLPILLLLVALAGVGWIWGSPYLVVRAMERAADARDANALSARVDYPALRQSVKDQLRRRAVEDGGAAEGVLLGALLEAGIAGSVVDAAVTPEGIRLMFAAGAADSVGEARATLDARSMALRRDALDRFRLVRTDGGGGALVFALRGLRWKLVEIQLPPRQMEP